MKYLICLTVLFSMILSAMSLSAGPNLETLSVAVRNWDGTAASALSFNHTAATAAAPWVRSPQYLLVGYTTDETTWGLRIYTDTRKDVNSLVYPKPLAKVDSQWHWETYPVNDPYRINKKYKYISGNWDVGNDGVSFAGMIDTASMQNPNTRAMLAWQVWKDPLHPAEPDAIFKHPFYSWWNVGTNPYYDGTFYKQYIYKNDWAPMADKSDKWGGKNSIGEVFYKTWDPGYGGGQYDTKPEIFCNGANNPAFIAYLSQYPPGSMTNPPIRDADNTIAVYLAANFYEMKTDGVTVQGKLPGGTYNTMIYIDLIHE